MTQVTERKRELNQSGWARGHLLHGCHSDCLAMPGKLHITHIVGVSEASREVSRT